MAIQFTVSRRGPLPGEEGGQGTMYPRLRSQSTTDVVEFQKHAPWGSVMTPAGLQMALGELQRIMLHELRQGNAVVLPGIGTFRLGLRGTVEVADGSLHGRDVRVAGLLFQPDRELRDELVALPVDQQPFGQLVAAPADTVEEHLAPLFARHDTITHHDVFQAYGATLSAHRVTTLLRRLVAEGRLQREGERSQARYRAVPGHFGR